MLIKFKFKPRATKYKHKATKFKSCDFICKIERIIAV